MARLGKDLIYEGIETHINHGLMTPVLALGKDLIYEGIETHINHGLMISALAAVLEKT